ncbi:MAG: DNA topoisomerase I [Planctomycetaceae bacterium]|nr:DNA topoisomerase I [Planctomycetaceae bacterium]
MGGLFRALMNLPLFKSALRPVTRVIVGVIAIPVFRFIMRRVFRLQDLDDELEKDLEQWFRGALLLLAASANMEHLLFGWTEKLEWMDRADWLTMGLRLMLAIGVIEAMPDQELFAVIHPGPPKIKPGRSALVEFWRKKWAFLKGFACQHLNRSSPVLAMMTAIVGGQLLSLTDVEHTKLSRTGLVNWSYCQQLGAISPAQILIGAEIGAHAAPEATFHMMEIAKLSSDFRRHKERWLVGWCCYLMAITQYLIIGLVTSRDRAMDVLSEFDRAVQQRRKELVEEFRIEETAVGEQPNGVPHDESKPSTSTDATTQKDSPKAIEEITPARDVSNGSGSVGEPN